jgi:hypothetical protein
MGTPLYPKDLGTEWMKLRTGIKDAFTSANTRVPYEKIGAGVLKVFQELEMQAGSVLKFLYSNGVTGVIIGRHESGSGPADGLYIQRADGTIALWTFSRVADGSGFTAIYDQSENIIFSDDDVAGQGIGRPWIPVTFAPTAELTTPPANRTTSGTTDVPVYTTFHQMQHPKVHYQGYLQVGVGGSTAEIKFKNNIAGTVMHSTTVGNGWVSGEFALTDWNFGDTMNIDVTIRRASGSGSVGFTLVAFEGRQS